MDGQQLHIGIGIIIISFQNPINTRDAMISALSDAQYVAPLVQSGDLLSGGPKPALNDEEGPRRPTKTYFYVFDYQTKDGFYPQVGVFNFCLLSYIVQTVY